MTPPARRGAPMRRVAVAIPRADFVRLCSVAEEFSDQSGPIRFADTPSREAVDRMLDRLYATLKWAKNGARRPKPRPRAGRRK